MVIGESLKKRFLPSGDATFRHLANFLRYVNIVAQHVNIVAQPPSRWRFGTVEAESRFAPAAQPPSRWRFGTVEAESRLCPPPRESLPAVNREPKPAESTKAQTAAVVRDSLVFAKSI